VLSKGTLLFMTSQLRNDTTIEFCSESICGNYELSLPLPYILGNHIGLVKYRVSLLLLD
jgi:hypothetical protein